MSLPAWRNAAAGDVGVTASPGEHAGIHGLAA